MPTQKGRERKYTGLKWCC